MQRFLYFSGWLIIGGYFTGMQDEQTKVWKWAEYEFAVYALL